MQPKTLVLLTMAVNMFASKGTMMNLNACAMLIMSWRVMAKVVEVLRNVVTVNFNMSLQRNICGKVDSS